MNQQTDQVVDHALDLAKHLFDKLNTNLDKIDQKIGSILLTDVILFGSLSMYLRVELLTCPDQRILGLISLACAMVCAFYSIRGYMKPPGKPGGFVDVPDPFAYLDCRYSHNLSARLIKPMSIKIYESGIVEADEVGKWKSRTKDNALICLAIAITFFAAAIMVGLLF
jgi:hypothetical protein